MHKNIHKIHTLSSQAGQRLDIFITNNIENLSRSRAKFLIQYGNVSVEKKKITDPNYRVKNGSFTEVLIPEPKPSSLIPQEIPLNIIFEDKHIIVLNKDAGMVVHPAAGNQNNTLVNALISHCGETLLGIGAEKRPGIVHRLDKDTSGIMIVAKTEIAHINLSKQFFSHSIERIYEAIIWGCPKESNGTITTQIGRKPTDRKKMSVVKKRGRNAITHYKTKEIFGKIASLIQCRLDTGRTHQIRVHMNYIGHSLLGDPLYGRDRRKIPDHLSNFLNNFNRQALHSSKIKFQHPETNSEMEFSANLPEDFLNLYKTLKLQK